MSRIDTYTGKVGRPRKPIIDVPTKVVTPYWYGDGAQTQNTSVRALERIMKDDFSCKCRNLIQPVETPDQICGLCGSRVIYGYRHYAFADTI